MAQLGTLMAYGTPVIAVPVGVIPNVIIDGKTGFIMEYNSLNLEEITEVEKAV